MPDQPGKLPHCSRRRAGHSAQPRARRLPSAHAEPTLQWYNLKHMFALCQLTELVRSAGRRHTSDRPAYTWEKRTDNKTSFLQNKTPDRPATKPAENTRPGRRPMPGGRGPITNYGFCKTKAWAGSGELTRPPANPASGPSASLRPRLPASPPARLPGHLRRPSR